MRAELALALVPSRPTPSAGPNVHGIKLCMSSWADSDCNGEAVTVLSVLVLPLWGEEGSAKYRSAKRAARSVKADWGRENLKFLNGYIGPRILNLGYR
jgi:hypothetical protein